MNSCHQRFPRSQHICRSADFQAVYQRRASSGDGWLLVYGCPNRLEYPRLGLSVSRRVGGAVRRNRWKRLLREAFRLHRGELPVGIDLVVIPRAAVEPKLEELAHSLVRLARRVAKKLEHDR